VFWPLFLNNGGKVGSYFEELVGVWVGRLTFEGKMLGWETVSMEFVFIFKTFC
jgi:hypothetical protein